MVVIVFLELDFALICAVSPMQRDSLNPTMDLWYGMVIWDERMCVRNIYSR